MIRLSMNLIQDPIPTIVSIETKRTITDSGKNRVLDLITKYVSKKSQKNIGFS